MNLITEKKLTKGDIVTAVIINYSIGGNCTPSSPHCFTKRLRFAGNDENGIAMWEESYVTISTDTPISYNIGISDKWRRYDNDNWIVVALFPERLTLDTGYRGISAWKRNLKIEELQPVDEFTD